MPRAFSSGAASIASYALNSPPKRSAPILVSAAVSVVLPWSTWPMVPTLTCGLVRSNLPLDICLSLVYLKFGYRGRVQDSALLDDGVGDIARRRLVMVEFHREGRATLGLRTQRGGVTKHLAQRNHRIDDAGRAITGGARTLQHATTTAHVAHHVTLVIL